MPQSGLIVAEHLKVTARVVVKMIQRHGRIAGGAYDHADNAGSEQAAAGGLYDGVSPAIVYLQSLRKSRGKGYKYEVFKSTKPTGKFKKAATAKKAKAVVKKLKKGKTFYFKVRGFKKVGGKKVYTQFSDVAKAKIK